MKPYTAMICVVLIQVCSVTLAAPGAGGANRQKWKEAAISYLATVSPTNTTRLAEIQIRGAAKVLRYAIEDEGLIRFGTHGWVYLKMNSSCDAARHKAALGDIVLAMDQDGNVYENDSHVCSGLIIKSLTGKEFQDIQEFLDTPVLKKKWRQLLRETPSAAGKVTGEVVSERQTWMAETLVYLKTIVPTPDTRLAEIQVRGAAKVLRYFIEDEGLIRLGTNGWCYVKIHTEEADYLDKSRIGEVILAIDHDGTVYQNDGEAESDILLRSRTGKEFQSIQEFLDTVVASPVYGQGKKWRRLVDETPSSVPKALGQPGPL
jgi:hypothetical protein